MKCSEPNLTQGNQKKTSKTSLHYCESNWNVFLLLYLVFTTLNKANFMMVTLVKMQILRVTNIYCYFTYKSTPIEKSTPTSGWKTLLQSCNTLLKQLAFPFTTHFAMWFHIAIWDLNAKNCRKIKSVFWSTCSWPN